MNEINQLPANSSFVDKVLLGTKVALRKLVIETAEKNGSLIIKVDGEIKEVPAKELLSTLSK